MNYTPRQTAKVSFDDMFPGFDAEAFIRDCVAKGVSSEDAKVALSPILRGNAGKMEHDLKCSQNSIR